MAGNVALGLFAGIGIVGFFFLWAYVVWIGETEL